MEFQQLTPNLWVGQSQLFLTNTGIWASGYKACLIDPCMFPKEIDAIEQFVDQRELLVESVLLTHSHWDHVLGPERFPNTSVIAHANYLSEIAGALGSRIVDQIAEWENQHNILRSSPFVLPQPDDVFDTTTALFVGDTELQLTAAPGHAPDQLVAYHADQRLLWASDILSDVEIPFVSDSLLSYQQTLENLSTWEVDILVPGHGHPSTSPEAYQTRIAEDRQYLLELKQLVSKAVEKGCSIHETIELGEAIIYRNPEENRGAHKANVESAYIELGGDADPTAFGWHKHPSATGS